MRINEEQVAVDSLKHVLCTRCGCGAVHIEPGNDPPDFNVTIDGDAFPAEVTSITSRQEYHAQCRHFVEIIRERALGIGILSGTYAFTIFRYPIVPKPASVAGRQLIESSVAFMGSTQTAAKTAEIRLLNDESGRISISKLSPNGAKVEPVWIAGMWEGDVQTELMALMQESVNAKKRKLTNAGIGTGKALLLFYAAFAFADPDDAEAVLMKVQGFEWFHSIFWAASFADRKNRTYPEQPGREGCFLHSMNTAWHRVGSIPVASGT